MNLIQIQKNSDGSYKTVTWGNHPDGSLDIVNYDISEATQKIIPILSKDLHGLPRDADFASLWINQDGTLDKTDFHNVSRTKEEAPGIATISAQDIQQVIPLVDTLKTDIQTKTGVTIKP